MATETITLPKAIDCANEVMIKIADEPPEFEGRYSDQALDEYYEAQAKRLEDALYCALPGGLYDHLVAVMLREMASLTAWSRRSQRPEPDMQQAAEDRRP